MPEEAPFDLSSSASTIPPAQKPKETTVSWSSHCVNQKTPSDYARDRAEKYANYFKEGEILPIPELVKEVEPKTLSFVVTDLKTKRLAGLKKETFEDLLKSANIPGKYFCRRSFATWDVLLPSEEVAKKLAGGNITTRFFRLQPEYRGKRRIKVTVCNVSMQLSGDVLAAYLSIYGGVEQVSQITSTRGTAYGDYVFIMCLDRGGFNNVPHKIKYRDQTMTVVVEGRKPLCWACNKIGHFSKNCPQKTTTTATTTTTTTTASEIITTKTPTKNIENHQENPNKKDEEGWTQVTRKKGGKKTPIKKSIAPTENKTNQTNTTKDSTTVIIATPTDTTTKTQSSTSTTATEQSSTPIEPMDMSINLKRRRNSEDSPTKEGEKRNPKKTTQQQTPSLPQPKGEGKKKISKSPATNERPAQIIPPLPQIQKITPINPIEIPLPPSLSPITTPKIFTRSQSVTRLSPDPQTASTSSSGQKPRARSASTEARHAMTAFIFCEDILENPNHDHILKTSLKPLRSFKKINNKDITNPYIFKDAPMLTTFVRTAGNRTKELWNFIDEASRADVMLANTKNAMLKKMLPFCSGRVPILVHPSFYRSLKLRYPMDVGELPGTTELALSSAPVPCVRPSASSPRRISGP